MSAGTGDTAPARAAQPSAAANGDAQPVISLRDASFGYGDKRIVMGVDLQIRRTETVALLGANGSGKSTLVRGLLGVCEHLGGQVDVLGRPLAKFSQRYLLGYVPQRLPFTPTTRATVSEIVAVGRIARHGLFGRTTARDRRLIAEAIDIVGLGDFARHDVSTLSGGQQRRVLIARALAAQPEVLVMDEPMAGVDIANQHLLVAVIRRLVEGGATLLVVTHDLAALRPVLHRAVTMEAGRIASDVPLPPVTAGAFDALTGEFDGAPGELPGHCHDVTDLSGPPTGSLLAPVYPPGGPRA